MNDLWQHKRLFFITYNCLFVLGLIVIFLTDQHQLHLNINQYHHPSWDMFFKYVTYLGDGIVFPIVIIGLFLIDRKWAIAFLYAGLLCLILSYVFKHYVFGSQSRPYEVFGNTLHLIDGVKMRHWHSFPSGHTISAFAMFTLAVYFTKKYAYQLLWLTLALIAGISRVYLSQHFVEDIVAGSCIGVCIATLAYWLHLRFPLFKYKTPEL